MEARAITEDKPCEAFWPARSKFEELVKNLQSERCRGMAHDELEVELAREGRELLRRMYQGHLDFDPNRVRVDSMLGRLPKAGGR